MAGPLNTASMLLVVDGQPLKDMVASPDQAELAFDAATSLAFRAKLRGMDAGAEVVQAAAETVAVILITVLSAAPAELDNTAGNINASARGYIFLFIIVCNSIFKLTHY